MTGHHRHGGSGELQNDGAQRPDGERSGRVLHPLGGLRAGGHVGVEQILEVQRGDVLVLGFVRERTGPQRPE